MKFITKTTIALMLILSVVLICGCSANKKGNLFADLAAERIEKITISKTIYDKTIEKQDDIKKFVTYLQGASVLKTETVDKEDGEGYYIKFTFTNGESESYQITNSSIKSSIDNLNMKSMVVDNDYFKPLIDYIENNIISKN